MIELSRFEELTVLIVGDVMLDRYWWGEVSRISPEAPVPVVKLERSTYSPGGAANVAANVAGLGANAVLVGVVGEDHEAETVSETLKKCGVSSEFLLRSRHRPTTVKTRVIAHGQQVARIDQETDVGLTDDDRLKTETKIVELIKSSDAVIVSDYAKGLIGRDLVAKLVDIARADGKPVLVDPKGKDYSKYDQANLITPNRKEAADAAGLETHEDVAVVGQKLLSRLKVESLLITQGEDGMTLFRRDTPPFHLSSLAREVYDVTGAGDTVIATLGVCIGAGLRLEEAADLANVAAGIVVGQIGTTAIRRADLEAAVSRRGSQQVV